MPRWKGYYALTMTYWPWMIVLMNTPAPSINSTPLPPGPPVSHDKFKRLKSEREFCLWISEYGAKSGFLCFQPHNCQRCVSHFQMCIIEGYWKWWKWCAVEMVIVWAWDLSARLGWCGSVVLRKSQWYPHASPGLTGNLNGRTLEEGTRLVVIGLREWCKCSGWLGWIAFVFQIILPRACNSSLGWSTYKNLPIKLQLIDCRSIQPCRSASDQHFRVQRITADDIFLRGSAGDGIFWNFDNSGSSLITSDFSVGAILTPFAKFGMALVAFYVTDWDLIFPTANLHMAAIATTTINIRSGQTVLWRSCPSC